MFIEIDFCFECIHNYLDEYGNVRCAKLNQHIKRDSTDEGKRFPRMCRLPDAVEGEINMCKVLEINSCYGCKWYRRLSSNDVNCKLGNMIVSAEFAIEAMKKMFKRCPLIKHNKETENERRV